MVRRPDGKPLKQGYATDIYVSKVGILIVDDDVWEETEDFVRLKPMYIDIDSAHKDHPITLLYQRPKEQGIKVAKEWKKDENVMNINIPMGYRVQWKVVRRENQAETLVLG